MVLIKSLALVLLASAAAASTGQWRDAAHLDTVAISPSSSDSPPAARRDGDGVDDSGDDDDRDDRDSSSLGRRATARSPRRYTPSSVDCPKQRPSIRNGSSLSPQEREWLPRRRNQTVPHIRALLKRIAIPDFDSDRYLRDVESDPAALPNVGLAVSGGGYRAMLNGAGVLAAWDSRSAGSAAKGNLGGLLQSATYLSGLSGGGWLVGSIYTNNFTSVMDAVDSPNIWQFDDSILKGPVQYSLLQYYKNILDDVDGKKKAGYDTSISDYWGRMLSYQLVNAPDGGPAFTFSSIADDPDFASAKTPLPFLIANGRAPGEKPVLANTTVFEFSPWELGSSDSSLDGFVPLRYVGSKFDAGRLPDAERCVNGFDNVGFVMGTSSSLFNQVVLYLKDKKSGYVPSDVPGFIVDAVTSALNVVGDDNNDIADWTPNPFKGWNRGRNPSADSDRLTLVDGGEDLQNIPYQPLLVSDRNVDVVFSVDSSADTDSGWPDGASAMSTYRRSLETGITASASAFPVVPGKDTFLNLGLNTRPAFFGCNATNTSTPTPLVVYLPNYPYVYASNISTFQMSISSPERDAMVQNGWALATQLNATRDPDWPACVGCAMLARSFDRTRSPVPEKCRQCFERYCWDGRIDEAAPRPYRPGFVGTAIKVEGSAASRAAHDAARAAVLIAAAAALGSLL